MPFHLEDIIKKKWILLLACMPEYIITLDINAYKITLEVSPEELEERRKAWVCPPPKVTEGYLARYAKLVSSADEGAILK